MHQSTNQKVNHPVKKIEKAAQGLKVQVPEKAVQDRKVDQLVLGKVDRDQKVDQVLPEKVVLDLEVEGSKD